MKKNQDFLLKIEDLSVIRSGKTLLEGINWEICPGENWAVLGKNGAGKSTLLRVILGYVSSLYGSKIYYFGKKDPFFNIWEVRKKIGYVSYELEEDYRYNERGIDVVLTGFYSSIGLYEIPNRELVKKAEESFEQFGITYLRDKKIREMSQGERQKVFLLRAFVHRPPILILDEPFLGLDIPSKEELLNIIENIGKDTSIILTTHSPDEIPSSISHVLYLKSGKVFDMGYKEEMLKNRLFSEVFDCNIELLRDGERYRVKKVVL